MEQEYYLNKNAAIFNCNICGDVQLRMTGEGEQPPGDGCYNPDCESNHGKNPSPGMKLEYIPYTEK